MQTALKPDIAVLKQRLAALAAGPGGRRPPPRLPLGPPPIDAVLGGGMARHALHEVLGPGAVFFAATLAGQLPATVAWIANRHGERAIFPDGVRMCGLAIQKTMFISAQPRNMLWAFEQAAKSGAVAVAVADGLASLNFAASRRLQLAAREGGAFALALLAGGRQPERPSASAADTRWRVTPRPATQSAPPCFCLELLKNKSGSTGAWEVCWDATTHRFRLAAQA